MQDVLAFNNKLKTSVQNTGSAVDFQQHRRNQHGCFLSGPSSESKRTMHSLSSVHDLSVFNAEPGSAVVLCSSERLVLGGGGGGVTGGSHFIVMRRCRTYDPTSGLNQEVVERGTVDGTPPTQEVTSQSCAFLPLPLKCLSL